MGEPRKVKETRRPGGAERWRIKVWVVPSITFTAEYLPVPSSPQFYIYFVRACVRFTVVDRRCIFHEYIRYTTSFAVFLESTIGTSC